MPAQFGQLSSAQEAAHEKYTPGYTRNASDFMARRTAQSHAAFVLPFLRPGMRLLDCGCGPGTVTLGLAQAVAPGKVVGIDREPSQLDAARKRFQEAGIDAQFSTGSIYQLPVPANSFDVVFAHALFEHLSEPQRALAEVYRVLKPGGLIALRSPDWGGFIVEPGGPALHRAIEFYKKLQVENGGDVLVGRKLKSLVRQAGFLDPKATGSYESYDPVDSIAEYLALRIEDSPVRDKTVERGWTTARDIAGLAAALRAFATDPDALFLQAWCEVIARKG